MSIFDKVYGEAPYEGLFLRNLRESEAEAEVWKLKYEASQNDLAEMQDKLKSHYGYHIAKDSS